MQHEFADKLIKTINESQLPAFVLVPVIEQALDRLKVIEEEQYKTAVVCPFCGRINYIFDEPNCDFLRLNTDVIPKNVDAFGSKIVIGWGATQ